MAQATGIFISIYILRFMIATYGLDSLDLPSIACPDNFRYQKIGRGVVGIITLYNVPFTTLNVEVKFSQIQPIQTFQGRLSFEPDLETVQRRFEDGSPIILKMIFPLSTEVPKLIRITMNNEDICSDDTPNDHKVFYTLRRSFTPTEGTHRKLNTTNVPESVDLILCGLSPFNPVIVREGQHDMKWGWFPWATKIYRSKTFDSICGGVLISTRTVIAAAHCFQTNNTAEDIVVHLGVVGLIDFVDNYPVTHRVKTILVHPDYAASTYSDADIALLQLDVRVKFNRYILPICLWNESDGGDKKVDEIGYATFFGSNGIDQATSATVISQSQCLQSNKAYIQTISSRTFCVDYNNISGSNFGQDAGSGLIMDRGGRWTLLGIYSTCVMHNEKCDTDLYFVYVGVAKFNIWIRENMWL